MKKVILSFVAISIALLLYGCSGGHHDKSGVDKADKNKPEPQAGQVTASEWNDLKNYEFYLSLFETSQEGSAGVFSAYATKSYFDTRNRITVTVNNTDRTIVGATVELLSNEQNVIYSAVTNANGIAYLFPNRDELNGITELIVKHEGETIRQDYQYSKENNQITIDVDAPSTHQNVIELMFVVDTTGSMRDELEYLKAEIDDVIGRVKEAIPNTTIYLALVFYRDHGDAYVIRSFDFTTDIQKQKQNLSEQSAAGGGDYEEAVDEALATAVSMGWSQANTTKLLFHVLDAPPHDEQENMTRYYRSIMTASQMGIRMIPIASSGINKYTEFLLRNEAMMTGGTYVFLTDDSGIGNKHLEPSVGDTVVEYLNHLMIRLIKEYHTGVEGEKIPYHQTQQV